MSREINGLYEFGEYRLDVLERLLVRGDQPIPLTPKVFDTLLVLVKHNGHLVEKELLMKEIWSDSFVEEANIARNVWTLRKALGDDEGEHRYIETVPKLGYRFIAPVRELNGLGNERRREVMIASPLVDVEPDCETVVKHPVQTGIPSSRLLRIKRDWVLVALAAVALVAVGYATFFRRTSNSSEPQIRSLAVLPLKSLTNQKDDEYLEIGLADTMITRISQINGLEVRPTRAIMKYKDQEITSLDAARQLQVESFIEGSFQHAGDQFRVNLNLRRVQDGASMWSDTLDVNRADGFKLQDQVAQRVATRLRLTLEPSTRSSARAIKPEALEDYWKAMLHAGTYNRTHNDTAIELLERAVAADPDFALAHAALAKEYYNRGVAVRPQEKEVWEAKASRAVYQALLLDPDLAEAHDVQSMLVWTSGNHFQHRQAIEEVRRALELNPNLDDAHHHLGLIYNHIGLLEKAQKEFQIAVAINPTNPGAQFRVGVSLAYQSKYELALSSLRESRKFDPPLWSYWTAWVLFQLGREDEAKVIVDEELKNGQQDEGGLLTSMEAMLAASVGDTRLAEVKIKRAAELGKDYIHFHHTEYAVASAYALMNKHDAALEWLKRTAADGFPCYPLFEQDANFKNLREDPKYQALMKTLKEQWEEYKATL
jgi:DNA-binding winged helix-turn-helix (wHTH) protein/TolB-like protein/Flp pilus assembly protein TadD